jgi:hypothetical protein
MHDQLEQSEQQLRLATSRSLPAGTELDAEAAAERDGFLALGGALDAAAAQLDEAALIARLRQTCLTKDDAPIALPSRRSASTWQMVFSVALAASALVAVVRITAPLQVTLPAAKMLVAKQEPPQSPDMAAAHGVAEPISPARRFWFDPLDDEIALAQAEFQHLAGGDRGVDGSLSQMNDRLEALSQELFQGSL